MPNWVVYALPFMEENSVLSQFNKSAYLTDDTNASFRASNLPVMTCPADPYTSSPFDGSQNNWGMGANWARGCYAANASLHFMIVLSADMPGPTNPGWCSALYRGVMSTNVALSLNEISDGSSKTCLLGEIRAGLIPIDSRGTWAMGGSCSSALYNHGWVGDDPGPNCPCVNADDVLSCFNVQTALGDQNTLVFAGMPCAASIDVNKQQTTRSMHPGGVLLVFCDGSVHWASDDIQVGSSATNLGVWDMIMLSQDGSTLSPDLY
jgi:hypothetical protein